MHWSLWRVSYLRQEKLLKCNHNLGDVTDLSYFAFINSAWSNLTKNDMNFLNCCEPKKCKICEVFPCKSAWSLWTFQINDRHDTSKCKPVFIEWWNDCLWEQNLCTGQLTTDAAFAQRFYCFIFWALQKAIPPVRVRSLPHEYQSCLTMQSVHNELTQVVTSNWE